MESLGRDCGWTAAIKGAPKVFSTVMDYVYFILFLFHEHWWGDWVLTPSPSVSVFFFRLSAAFIFNGRDKNTNASPSSQKNLTPLLRPPKNQPKKRTPLFRSTKTRQIKTTQQPLACPTKTNSKPLRKAQTKPNTSLPVNKNRPNAAHPPNKNISTAALPQDKKQAAPGSPSPWRPCDEGARCNSH